MINKIIEIYEAEDTFKLFTSQSTNSIYNIKRLKIKNFEIIKRYLLSLFKSVMDKSPIDSLYYNEALRLEKFTIRLFNEIDEINKDSTGDDNLINWYIDSLMNFIDGIDNELINDQVSYITS